MHRRGLVLRVLVVLGVLAVAMFLVTRWYLCSRSAADRVQSHLTNLLQAPVRVQAVDLGLSDSSTFSQLQILEVGAALGDQPFLTATGVEADASAWTLAWGRPQNLTLTEVGLTLRFDASGQFLTRLPGARPGGPLPRLRIRSGTVTLKQQGRPDLVVGGVEAVLGSAQNNLQLEGEFNDPRWGKGTVTGAFDRETSTLEGTVQTGVVHLTRQDLEGLPFIPVTTWQQVRCEGDTSATIALRVRTRQDGPEAVHYRVDLRPTHTRVHVTAIDLTAEEALGRVVIEDGVVHLEGVEGKTARGTIGTNAVLDFRQPESRMQFAITVAAVDLQQLPRTWKLPPLIGGRLNGRAELHLTAADGLPLPAGRGEGEVHGASILGFESRAPIRVRLVADATGFHFDAPRGPPPLSLPPTRRPFGGVFLPRP